ncbi:Na+/H+ antiporter [Sphingobacterium sp. BN32]|uniref:Na+/H+ antiporter n=1 Tax=Sphingobacterium sp. BN32 TaxID=3058432 RepID=UPI00265D1A47|nr:Na+/H+ antiporter [Sphingobacterium sp. BN32]WKK57156.1 Na+/H+ antiporter [Sphingobacterium sp. BN32]
MIESNILLVMVLFFFMAMLFVISQRFSISYPILLVIGGLAISLIPGMPEVSINPDIVFLIFLPPLLFEAAWYTSWHSFWKYKRSIMIMGFGLVFVTSLAVAYLSVQIIPGFTLALGFLLGGIISPPDAVAATSVLKGVNMPKRGITLLEGESLVNDAASLTVFRLALAVIITGSFEPQEAIVNFFTLAVMGIFVGLVIGHILYFFLRYVAKSSSITTPITLIAPYIMYIVAEHFEWSGVLAVVAGGLFLSFRSKDYMDYHTRIQTREVWDTVGFLLNGFVFILIGLELPIIIAGIEDVSMEWAIKMALCITAIIIVIRIVFIYGAAFIPRMIFKSVRKNESSPGWKLPLVIGWAGMRGVVSLASALAIPLTLSDGTAFPHRNLILFITFVVILITLVVQGLSLPWLIKGIKLEGNSEEIPEEVQIEAIRYRLAREGMKLVEEKYADELRESFTVKAIYTQMKRRLDTSASSIDQESKIRIANEKDLYKRVTQDVIDQRRKTLYAMHTEKKYDDALLRELEHNLDLEESRLNRK